MQPKYGVYLYPHMENEGVEIFLLFTRLHDSHDEQFSKGKRRLDATKCKFLFSPLYDATYSFDMLIFVLSASFL